MALGPSSNAGASQSSIFDFGALASLHRDVTTQPNSAEKQAEVARQFEAVYIQMLLKQMRQATMQSGMFDSNESRMVRSMADEQLALQLANPGIGLAQSLLKQMRANQPGEAGQGQDGGTGAQAPQQPLDLAARTVARAAPDGEVAALLRLLNRNRASDRALAAAEGAPDHVVDFVSQMASAAKAAERQSGVPARLILGQAALESGWGQREIRYPDGRTSYNLFGIKAGDSWKGKVVNVMTTEYEDGVPRKVMQPFRAYNSYEESFADYARLISDNPRYEAVTQARDEYDAARRIQAAGYATDPRYADKLIGIMGQLAGTAGAGQGPDAGVAAGRPGPGATAFEGRSAPGWDGQDSAESARAEAVAALSAAEPIAGGVR
ncbi:flagellar assembly peptidoglycan hydrolase FlgJ [Bordetella genomosp. 9]|uniref:Peptidoglycan hydrolase FlgJ n=1 Tax=Bordetella genomosp. 9 TaxID=1416803 RepID=A0A1W6Z174_9BORD|nr:flagellar assembly peptidoglycan hydrolase FlgJ [Bordetella genomosp. 9]ARP86944.1 flagellar assembly peptidoglycan hydrolase FlgJ [Bordetella genomosp. 9]